ncbi:lectin, galactoside-binding, soluble, 3 [Globodera pallida]|nr:lectin, galactoside-binding, soluble, 3 [Globodera pallida]
MTKSLLFSCCCAIIVCLALMAEDKKKPGDDKETFILSYAINGGADKVGAPFMLDVMAGTDQQQIVFYVNGKKYFTVPTVEGIPTSSKLKVYENSHLHTVELGVPYKGHIKGGIIGKTVRLVLTLLNIGNKRTHFDMLDKADDILFHLTIRPDEKMAGRSTRKGGVFGFGEEDGPFPFVMEKQSVLEFVTHKDKIEIVLDGKKAYEFKARDDLSKVVRFELFGALVLHSVNVLEK